MCGASTGLALVALCYRDFRAGERVAVSTATLVRGLLAGLAGAALLNATVGRDHELAQAWLGLDSGAAWLVALVIGAIGGLGYGLIYPRPVGGAGASLVRGIALGFLAWIACSLTALPVTALPGDRRPRPGVGAQRRAGKCCDAPRPTSCSVLRSQFSTTGSQA